jgi:hypothetical protein
MKISKLLSMIVFFLALFSPGTNAETHKFLAGGKPNKFAELNASLSRITRIDSRPSDTPLDLCAILSSTPESAEVCRSAQSLLSPEQIAACYRFTSFPKTESDCFRSRPSPAHTKTCLDFTSSQDTESYCINNNLPAGRIQACFADTKTSEGELLCLQNLCSGGDDCDRAAGGSGGARGTQI